MNEAKAQRQRIITPLSGGGSVTRSLTHRNRSCVNTSTYQTQPPLCSWFYTHLPDGHCL